MTGADFVGKPVRRCEDVRFLRGLGRFLDDMVLPGLVHAFVLRSPHAHAEIRKIDTAPAVEAPGVLAVVTASDWHENGLGPIPSRAEVPGREGRPLVHVPRPVLADGRVRHVGEPVVFIVAESFAAAREAAERVVVEYEPLPAVVDAAEALRPGAPQIWQEAPGNLCVDFETGDDPDAVEAAFAAAAHVVSLDLINNRVAATPLEPRGAIGSYDSETGRYTLTASLQNVHAIRDLLADRVLRIDRERLRVRSPDVGGGFGPKNQVYPELALVLHAACRIGRPVKWVSSRSEGFLSDNQGRDQRSRVELALDEEGRFLAYRVTTIADVGPYLSTNAPVTATTGTARMLGGAYRIPLLYDRVRVAFTNTIPTDSYRGAGRPEACYQIERIVDVAARELGLDPVELRRRNLITKADLPYRNRTGHEIDCGDLAAVLEKALEAADWKGFATRAAAAEKIGRWRGIGLCLHQSCTGGGLEDVAALEVAADGTVTLAVGTDCHGQGHETVYSQIVADRLGVPLDAVRVRFGDTTLTPAGGGYGGSRTLEAGGVAALRAVERVIDLGRSAAADLLEAGSADLEYDSGRFTVAGTDRGVGLAEVAGERELRAEIAYSRPGVTYPNGCHIAEVELDPETGAVRVIGYVVVDDFGTIINPLTAEGQIAGGVAQGLGQALLEGIVYEPGSGQLLTGSLMDYCLPRASHLPSFRIAFHEDEPTARNPLGVKGCGESGAVSAPPAVVNAVVDALAPWGVRHLDMPITAEAVWRAIRGGRLR